MKSILKASVFLLLKGLLRLFKLIDKTDIGTLSIITDAYEDVYRCHIITERYGLYPSKQYVPTKIKTITREKELAIVIQGVIEEKDDYTLETVRLYKKLFPHAAIIISTWDNTKDVLLEKFRAEGCEIVLSKNFDICGLGNVNYQICTSLAGIKRAKELGASYVIKNRSDLRIHREFTFEYLKALVETNPVEKGEIPLKGRIITFAGFSGQLFYTNWYQDFFYFGYTEDLLDFFDIPYNDRQGSARRSSLYMKEKYNGIYTGADMCSERVPEVYITTSFLSKYIPYEDSVKFSWEYHRKYFLVIDFSSIGAIWNKYGRKRLSIENDGTRQIEDYTKNINQLFSSALITNQIKYEEWMEQERAKIVLRPQ